MTRRLLSLPTALALLLCVAVAALWARSHFRSDLLFSTPADAAWSFRVVSGFGGVGFVLDQAIGKSEVDLPGIHWSTSPQGGYARGGWEHRAGFALVWERPMYGLAVPFWFLLAASVAATALLAAARARRARRRQPGTCNSCGYDLRATPGRCPECGSGRGA